MAKFVDYSVTAVCDAVRTVLGWTTAIIATTLLGLWLGMSISGGELVSIDNLLFAWLLLSFGWLVSLRVAAAIAVTAVAWYLPLKIESNWLMIVALCVNFASWLGITLSLSWPAVGIGA